MRAEELESRVNNLELNGNGVEEVITLVDTPSTPPPPPPPPPATHSGLMMTINQQQQANYYRQSPVNSGRSTPSHINAKSTDLFKMALGGGNKQLLVNPNDYKSMTVRLIFLSSSKNILYYYGGE